MEDESEAVKELQKEMKAVKTSIAKKEDLLSEVNMASNNFFMVLQKYKIDPVSGIA